MNVLNQWRQCFVARVKGLKYYHKYFSIWRKLCVVERLPPPVMMMLLLCTYDFDIHTVLSLLTMTSDTKLF